MNSQGNLLIVYHSMSGTTDRLSKAIEDGALKVHGVKIIRKQAFSVTVEDLVQSRTIVICSPEYFGYMAGAIKDLFDRTYEAVREKMFGKSYSILICAGNDGTGALSSIERIIAGFKMKRVQEPIINRGKISQEILAKCSELGQTLAAGMDLGIY